MNERRFERDFIFEVFYPLKQKHDKLLIFYIAFGSISILETKFFCLENLNFLEKKSCNFKDVLYMQKQEGGLLIKNNLLMKTTIFHNLKYFVQLHLVVEKQKDKCIHGQAFLKEPINGLACPP